MTIPRRVLALLVALVMAVVAVPSGVAAAPHSPGIRVSSLRLRHRATPKHVAAYTYDALSLLSSQSARASYARGVPPGLGAVPWGTSVAVVACCVAAKSETTVVGNVLRDERGSVRLGGLGDGGIEGASGKPGKLADQFGYSTKDIRSAIHGVKKSSAFPGNLDVVVDPAREVYPVGRDGLAGDSIGNIFEFLGGGR